MKVILLAPTPPPAGGMASWTMQMLASPLKNGWQIDLVDTKMIGGREVYGDGEKRKLGWEIKRCFGIWKQLRKKLRDEEAAVVHSGIPSLPLSMLREYVCARLTRHDKKKFIMHFHCTVPNTTKGKLAHFLLKRLCNQCDCIIVLNEQSKAYLAGITDTKTVVIPNFIVPQQVAQSHTVGQQVEKVLYVGGVIESKGVLEMMEVAKHFPQIQFRFVGRADEAVLSQTGDSKNLVFTGVCSKEEVQRELAEADVFMFLSHFYGEGFSIALTEAMAAGLPCIVTDWAANADMIDDGEGGFVVPVGAPELAKEALEKLLPYEIRSKQSEHNIEKVKACYLADTVKAMYVQAYESCLDAGK